MFKESVIEIHSHQDAPASVRSVEMFAHLVLDLIPVRVTKGKGFMGRYLDSKTNLVKRFYVSHEQIIHIYSSVNRFMRELSYDTDVVKRDVEGNPYLCFEKEHNGMKFGKRLYLSPGMETIFDIPLSGGRW